MPPTPTRSRYVAIAGVPLATRAVNLYGFADLYATPAHRGDDYVVPGASGIRDRGRVVDAHRALLSVRVDGRYVHATDAPAADPVAGVFDAWDVVRQLAAVTTTQLLELYVAGVVYASANVRVLELTAPRELTPWTWDARLDVLLPDGPLL